MSLQIDPASVRICRESSQGYYAFATGVRWGEHVLCWKRSGVPDFGTTGWSTAVFPAPFRPSVGTQVLTAELSFLAVATRPVL